MDREPFEHVVAAHGARVLRVCRAMLGAADADDAWSETFIAALRAYPTLRAGSNVGAWLVTIAHHKAIDQIRKRQRAPVPASAETIDQHAMLQTLETDVDTADVELRRAVAELTDRQRMAVVYHHIGGLSYAEIAALLGSTEAAARRSAADGIARLRTTYRKETNP